MSPAGRRPGARRFASRSSWLLVGGLLLLVVAAGALLYAFASDYQVLEKGQLLPYTEGKVYKVRFGGWLTLYVEPEQRPSLDLLNAYLLTGVAFMSLTFGVIVAAAGGGPRGTRFWCFVAAFVGASYLVADETLGIHETIGHNLQFLKALPLIKRPDDAVVVLFALPAALFLIAFRSVLLASRGAALLFGLGMLGFVLSAAADVLTLPIEEAAEVLATLCLAAGTMVLGLHHTRSGPPSARRG